MRNLLYDSKEGKKVALRFLKEAGLYSAWKEYVTSDEKRKKYCSTSPKTLTVKNWYIKNYIDEIFGETLFTNFLLNKYNFYIPSTISTVFRFYLSTIYGKKFMFNLRRGYDSVSRDLVTIDKETGNVNLFKK